MWLRDEGNKHGTGTSFMKCDTCDMEYSVIPKIPQEERHDKGWQNCLTPECPSYDPHRDAEVLFMSNAEIAREKKVVSIDMLRQRKKNNG